MDDIQKQLEGLLQAHGLRTELYGNWVLVDGDSPAFSGSIRSLREAAAGTSLQLDIIVFAGDEINIEVSSTGTGATREQALQDALENFAHSSLHVLVCALCGIEDEQVRVEHWEIAGAAWEVFIGDFSIRSSGEEQPAPPQELCAIIERCVRGLPLEGDLHWVCAFHGSSDAGTQVTEVQLDNEPWEAARKAAAGLDWPQVDAWYNLHMFFILRRAGGA